MPGLLDWTVMYEERDCGYETPCWYWLGASERGRATWGGRAAHRRLYILLRGPVEGVLHHRCHIRMCVNPDHMETVATQSEHMRLHPDNPGYFKKGSAPRPPVRWKQLRDDPFVLTSRKRRRYLVEMVCDGCGQTFLRRADLKDRATTRRRFCGKRCYWDHKGPDRQGGS